jgi:hypothetical protein
VDCGITLAKEKNLKKIINENHTRSQNSWRKRAGSKPEI